MSLIKTLRSWWGTAPAVPVQKIDPNQIDLEVPRYPPFVKGLPTLAPERLIQSQDELLVQLARVVTVSKSLYEQHYLGVLRRFVSYCHLLPASQAHHHRGAGGLLRHSIEVGLWAAQASDKLLLDLGSTPAQRRQIEPRWQLTAFVAGLCHDVGKPATDLVVTSHDRTKVWKPLTENLSDWATANDISAYFLDWRPGRAKQHVALSNLLADRIIGAETLGWIEEGGTELVVWLMEALNANPGARNPLFDLVATSDQASVERDMKTLGVAMAGYELGVPVERHLTDIMRRLIREGVWQVNEPGARVWNIGGAVYLVWPAAGDEIASKVREDGVPGIARTGDGILDMLIERQLAFVRDHDDGERFWKVVPAVLEAKFNKRVVLSCIRLRDDAMISSVPLASVQGLVINGSDAAEIAAEEEQPGEATERAAAPCPVELIPAAGVPADEPVEAAAPPDTPAKVKKVRAQKVTDADRRDEGPGAGIGCPPVAAAAQMEVDPSTGEILSMSLPQPDGSTRQVHVRKAELAGEGKKGLSAPVALVIKRKDPAAAAGDQTPSADVANGEAPLEREAPAKRAKRKGLDLSRAPTLQFDGAVGAMLQALAEDLKSGTKQWGVDARVDDEEMAHLKWPAAFSGYGLSGKAILDECVAKSWIWVDPYTPMVRVHDSEFQGESCKALRLTPDATYTLLHMAGYSDKNGAQRAPTPAPVAATAPAAAVEQAGLAGGARPEQQPAKSAPERRGAPSTQATLDLGEDPPKYLDDVPPMEFDDTPPQSRRDISVARELSPPAAVAQDSDGVGRQEHTPDATLRSAASARSPTRAPKPRSAQAATSERGQDGGAASPEANPPRAPRAQADPLRNTGPFPATKFDKFVAIVRAMPGTTAGDGWITLDRKACVDACKAQGVDLTRRDLKAFTDHASDHLKIEGASVRLKALR